MATILNRFIGKKMISLLIGSVVIPVLAAKGIDLGIPPEKLTEVIYTVFGLFATHMGSQGLADGLSGGATSSSANK